ncbi:MAG: hypothetical protein M3463_17090, partial [Verrucomicrobiota bacterium]|nr:hypothetical protein [Verrucomicrobiota bacterium]
MKGQTWNLAMPGVGAPGLLTDDKLAALLSYIRRAWGNTPAPIEPALVQKVRAHFADRTLPWTAAELTEASDDQVSRAAAITPNDAGELLLPASKAATIGQKLGYRPSLDVLAPWRLEQD